MTCRPGFVKDNSSAINVYIGRAMAVMTFCKGTDKGTSYNPEWGSGEEYVFGVWCFFFFFLALSHLHLSKDDRTATWATIEICDDTIKILGQFLAVCFPIFKYCFQVFQLEVLF